jgi:uncharacterized protein (DUF1810 family)
VASCGFSPTVVPVSCSDFDETNLTPLTSQSTQFGFQDVDTIAAIHGTGTAKVDGKSLVKVQQSVASPSYADKATVFLNGWRANYPDSDHHLINVGRGIGNIKTAQVEVLKSGGYRTLRFQGCGFRFRLTHLNPPVLEFSYYPELVEYSPRLMTRDPYNFQRFLDAQPSMYHEVLAELRAGQKQSHWMWFIFPQIKGLGRSPTAVKFAINSRAEAQAYAEHPILGARLRECTQLVNAIENRPASQIFGYPDDLKFHSSMTLFAAAAAEPAVFHRALLKYFAGELDTHTLAALKFHD